LALVTKTKESSFPSLQAEYLNILKQANYKLWAWSIKPQERLVAAPSMAKGPSVLLNRKPLNQNNHGAKSQVFVSTGQGEAGAFSLGVSAYHSIW
jgi:hypothetical protein